MMVKGSDVISKMDCIFDFDSDDESIEPSQGIATQRSSIGGLTPEEELYDPYKGPQEFKYGILLPPNRAPLKLLMVFQRPDAISDAFARAADKLGFDVTTSNSYDTALEEFLLKLHDLVIIDARSMAKTLDFDTLCRSIRNTRGSQHAVVVAIVRKRFVFPLNYDLILNRMFCSAFDKDDIMILSLLEAGYNRCLIENANVMHCVNELLQLKHSDIRPVAQHATNQILYSALDKCQNPVLITDDTFRLQYVNTACEHSLGYRTDETVGKTLQDNVVPDAAFLSNMHTSLSRGREWQGNVSFRRKSMEPLVATCKALPITCAGRVPTHYAIILDPGGDVVDAIVPAVERARGSVQSIRRASMKSLGSDYLRRTSLAKLSNLPIEAPITKIIHLLAQAQEVSSTNNQVVQILDKVVDMLHSTELYAPNLKEDYRIRAEEPVASDLITALLSQQQSPHLPVVASRRSSNDSSAPRAARTLSKLKIPTQLKDIMEDSLCWEFDIFKLEELTNHRPLVHLGMNLFSHFDVGGSLNCDDRTLYNWLTIIELHYHSDNPYHNSTHAADVMQATAGFLERERLKSIMEPMDEAVCLIAACAHDVDHPGKSNAFLCNADNVLAILYNDITVLESHHSALMFKLTLGDERVNIFKYLDKDLYKIVRHNVIDMILATEMTKHFEHLAKFVNVFCPKNHQGESELDDNVPPLMENLTLIKRMIIKCADVSNPTRPFKMCVEWAKRIAEEYFQQTDDEKTKGLPVVMPMFDRLTCSIPKSQIGFVDFIVNDMFEAWDAFIDFPELVTFMRQNYIRWKEFDEEGHRTAADMAKVQALYATKIPVKKDM